MKNELHLTLEEIYRLVAKEPSFVFPWACDPRAGFGANFSGLTKSLAMALSKGIGFKLVGLEHPSGIAISEGYTDFFLPFCDYAKGLFLERLNRSPLPSQARLPFIPKVVELILKQTTGGRGRYFAFTSHDNIPSLGSPFHDCDLAILRRAISLALWQYQAPISAAVTRVKTEITLPSEPYLSTCIRRGDKIVESSYAELSLYTRKILPLRSQYKYLFIAGDDLNAIQRLAASLPDFHCFYLVPPFRSGFVMSDFHMQSASRRLDLLVRFFAQIDLMRESSLFLGTRTTNVSYIINSFKSPESVLWID